MMQELPEARATGELAVIYEELRTTCAVPYVSSLQRHLATMPGCLEYAWALLRPAFVSGLLPETAWRLASMMPVAPLPPLTPCVCWGSMRPECRRSGISATISCG